LVSVVPVIILAIWVQRAAVDREMGAANEKHVLLAHNLTLGLSQYVRDAERVLGTPCYLRMKTMRSRIMRRNYEEQFQIARHCYLILSFDQFHSLMPLAALPSRLVDWNVI
jgi:hypothetical protein